MNAVESELSLTSIGSVGKDARNRSSSSKINPSRRKAIKNVLTKIKILENRLSKTEGVTDPDPLIVGLLSDQAICTYYFLLGDAYWTLLKLNYEETLRSQNSTAGLDVTERCLASLSAAHKKSQHCVGVHQPLRLLCVYTYCSALIKLKNRVTKAKDIAVKVFESASLHTNSMTASSMELLQRIREDVLGVRADGENIENTLDESTYDILGSGKSQVSLTEVNTNINKGKQQLQLQITGDTAGKANGQQKMSFSGLGLSAGEGRSSGLNSTNITPRQRSGKEVDTTGAAVVSTERYADQLLAVSSYKVQRGVESVLRLRRIVAQPVPVHVESIASSVTLLKALDRIFRSYVRGNALPGQLQGSNTVAFDGNPLSFRNFILDGPYMSFKGFVHFLLDFNIAKPPPKDTAAGTKFSKNVFDATTSATTTPLITPKNTPRNTTVAVAVGYDTTGHTVGAGGADTDGLGGAVTDSPVTMRDAALLFMESYRSVTPLLVLRRFLPVYQEMAGNVDTEPWHVLLQAVTSPTFEDWDIKCGINFMQFIDCIGKLGAVAYCSPRFTEIFPNLVDKIEHFLAAYLGLADLRKWQPKVEQKLTRAKTIIQQVARSGETTAAAAVAARRTLVG